MLQPTLLTWVSVLQDILDEEDLLGDMKEKQSHHKEEQEEEEDSDPSTLLGSHRDLHGGSCELLANQFQLHSQVSKKHQMVLLEVRSANCNVVFYKPVLSTP